MIRIKHLLFLAIFQILLINPSYALNGNSPQSIISNRTSTQSATTTPSDNLSSRVATNQITASPTPDSANLNPDSTTTTANSATPVDTNTTVDQTKEIQAATPECGGALTEDNHITKKILLLPASLIEKNKIEDAKSDPCLPGNYQYTTFDIAISVTFHLIILSLLVFILRRKTAKK